MIKTVIKRDGSRAEFNIKKIASAIYKAMKAEGLEDYTAAMELAKKVVTTLEAKALTPPKVEEIQDVVEEVLMVNGYTKVAKAYIIYREKRKLIRELKTAYGVKDYLKHSINAIKVLENRYLLKNENGEIIETPKQLYERVANYVALIDILYQKEVFDVNATQKVWEEDSGDNFLGVIEYKMLKHAYMYLNKEHHMKVPFSKVLELLKNNSRKIEEVSVQFYKLLSNKYFLPNSPTLMNAGTEIGQLSACFVLPINDSMEDIFEAVKNAALIHKSGGGTGFSFSNLRPAGDIVGSTKGVASGPVSFMRIFDVATDVIKQGGKRRGANMGILRIDHPDIIEFITSKDAKNTVFSNFNISVAITDEFMKALKTNSYYNLYNPRDKSVVRRENAQKLWDLIVSQAWKTGDPGLIFIDEINRKNPTPNLGAIESTNPCGEQPLHSYESCNLGSINLSKVVVDGRIDWDMLRYVTREAVHFLDNVIDANKFPLSIIEERTKLTRKIGLGVMGFADMLIKLEIPYNSEEALAVAEQVMSFISKESHKKSEELAYERGTFPAWAGSKWYPRKMRNATTTTIAPTGTISIIADTSSSIEPLFALAFIRNVMDGTKLLEINPLFEAYAKKHGFYSDELIHNVAKTGSIQHLNIPAEAKNLFVTAHDIDPEWHVLMQATFQKYVDNAVSKTINLRHEATMEDIEKAYLTAYNLKCKGITVYRDGSKSTQVIYQGVNKEKKDIVLEMKLQKTDESLLSIDSTFDPACQTGKCDL